MRDIGEWVRDLKRRREEYRWPILKPPSPEELKERRGPRGLHHLLKDEAGPTEVYRFPNPVRRYLWTSKYTAEAVFDAVEAEHNAAHGPGAVEYCTEGVCGRLRGW